MNLGFFFIRTWGSFIETWGSFGCVNRVVGSFIHIMRPKRNPSWHKTLFECLLYTFVICIYVYQFFFFFFFWAYLFLLCMDIFKLFSQTQTLFKDLNMRSLSITNWCLSLCFKFNYFCSLAKKKKKSIIFVWDLKKNSWFWEENFFFLSFL